MNSLKKSPPNIFRRIYQLRENKYLTVISLLLLAVGTGFCTLLAATSIYGMPMFWAYLKSPAVLALNILPIVILIIGLYFATGRAFLSFIAPSFFALLCAAINFFKIQVRGDPFIFEDILLAVEASKTLSQYTLQPNWKLFTGLAYLILAGAYSLFICRYRPKKRLIRLVASVLTFGVLIGVGIPVYTSDTIYYAASSDYNFDRCTVNEEYISRGFLYPFLNSIKTAIPQKPDGYSGEEAEEILAYFDYDDIPEDKKVNLISIMLEAYCDMTDFDSVEFTTDVYQRWHDLEEESVSGRLIDNIFAGGTIDTERLFLTGEISLKSMNRKTQSYVHYLKDQGYMAEGFHPGNNWFYDRTNVHEYLGFDNYYFFEDFEDADATDTYFFDKVLELYDSRDKTKPYFNHSLTIQNHGAYYDSFTVGPDLISREGLGDSSFNILNNYLTGIYDTNERIFEFIETLRKDKEPVVVVMYGDHMPWLGNSERVYDELGINLDVSTAEGFYNTYSTPYIIWANDAAKKVLDNDFKGDGGDFSPCFLMNKVFSLCSWRGDEYMKTVNDLYRQVSVIHTLTGMYVEEGVFTDTLSDKAQKALAEVEFASYFRRYKFD